MLGKRLKHARRYREILHGFLRNGFGYLIKDLGLSEAFAISIRKTEQPSDISQRSLGERLRNLFQDLGTTFIKLGQIASTRRDLLPESIIRELEQLQKQVPPFSFSVVEDIIRKELGADIEAIFSEFSEKPVASASIAQVHKARLRSGQKVAVKIQRPEIKEVIATDLEIPLAVAKPMDAKFDWAKTYRVLDLVEEFSRKLMLELDFSNEGRNTEKVANQFVKSKTVKIPKIYWNYTTKKILTMEFIDGININDDEKLTVRGYERKKIAADFAECMFQQIFSGGYFHGDPHPGNVVVMADGKIGLIDFGLIGHLSQKLRYQFVTLILALKKGKTEMVIDALHKMGLFPDDVDYTLLKFDIERIIDKYYDIPLKNFHMGQAINDLFRITLRHHIQLPTEFTVLGKTLLTLEGIISHLDPDFNMMKFAEPYAEKIMKEYYHPRRLAETTFHQLRDYGELFMEFPKTLQDVTSMAKKGKLRLEISAVDLNTAIKKLNQISNKISFSIVLLAFSIVCSGLIIGSSIVRQSTLIWEIPIIEIGAVIASFMFLWLLFAIFRSGRF